MAGSSNDQLFHKVGPFHLKNVNWDEANHCRTVAATLVKAVYALENDRTNNREGNDALAPPWWQFFKFQKIDHLADVVSGSIYCAIFRYNDSTDRSAPRYVIAFRGTILKVIEDLKVNLKLIKRKLKETHRFKETMSLVEKYTLETHNIWLTGHSLGASIALQVGRDLAMNKVLLPTHLFNSPFISVSISSCIKNEKLSKTVHAFGSLIKLTGAGLIRMVKPDEWLEDSFLKLVNWKPILYVHANDYICLGYISYFQDRDNMKKIDWFRWIEMFATRHSKIAIFKKLRNSFFTDDNEEEKKKKKKNARIETLHLIPSARLVVNNTPADADDAHRIKQWWRAGMELVTIDYECDE